MVRVTRTQPAPESLAIEKEKSSGRYDKEDVVERLTHDFNNKCYICELDDLSDPVVEHLLPHKNGYYRDRKFDWDNLFFACNHCNGVKNQQKYDAGIIDCTKEDPEKKIVFMLFDDGTFAKAINDTDEKAILTAYLVNEVFNKTNTGMRTYACQHRINHLAQEMSALLNALNELEDESSKAFAIIKLKALLRRESAFAAFKRCYVRQHLNRYPGLAGFVKLD